MNRISGPLLDRIDMHIEVTPVDFREMGSNRPEEGSATVRERVMKAREVQRRRFSVCPGVHTNYMMNSKMIKEYAPLDSDCITLLERAMSRLSLSARAYDRIIKLARTIADMEANNDITPSHIAEAINYRSLDRENWGN